MFVCFSHISNLPTPSPLCLSVVGHSEQSFLSPQGYEKFFILKPAAKNAVVGDISVEVIPFSDLKTRTNKYILELWQSECDEFPENKLHKYFQF